MLIWTIKMLFHYGNQPNNCLLFQVCLRTLQMSSTTGQQCCKWHNVLFQAGTRAWYITYSYVVTNSIKYHQQLQFAILPWVDLMKEHIDLSVDRNYVMCAWWNKNTVSSYFQNLPRVCVCVCLWYFWTPNEPPRNTLETSIQFCPNPCRTSISGQKTCDVCHDQNISKPSAWSLRHFTTLFKLIVFI